MCDEADIADHPIRYQYHGQRLYSKPSTRRRNNGLFNINLHSHLITLVPSVHGRLGDSAKDGTSVRHERIILSKGQHDCVNVRYNNITCPVSCAVIVVKDAFYDRLIVYFERADVVNKCILIGDIIDYLLN